MLETTLYSIFSAVALSFSALLFFFRGSHSLERVTTYYRFLRWLALFHLLSGGTGMLLLYLHVEGMDSAPLKIFYIPFISVAGISVMTRMFETALHTAGSYHKVQNVIFNLFMICGLLHPLLFSRFRTLQNLPLTMENYSAFLKSWQSMALLYTAAGLAIIYLSICIFDVAKVMGNAIVARGEMRGRFNAYTNLLFCGFFFAILAKVLNNMIFDTSLHLNYLLLRSVVIAAISIIMVNTKREYMSMERLSIEFKVRHCGESGREQKIVSRLLREWVSRAERPYLNPNLTIADLSKETGVSEGVLVNHINTVYGISFEEFISYLKNK